MKTLEANKLQGSNWPARGLFPSICLLGFIFCFDCGTVHNLFEQLFPLVIFPLVYFTFGKIMPTVSTVHYSVIWHKLVSN